MSIEPDRTYDLPNHAALVDDSNSTRPNVNSEAVAASESSGRSPAVAKSESVVQPDRAAPPASNDVTPLFDGADQELLRAQWRQVQGDFVDDPSDAVTRADALLAETIERLTATCVQRMQALHDGWSHDQDGDTEKLRQALRSYRSLFNKLLTV